MSGRSEAEAFEKAAKKFNVPKEKIHLKWGKLLGIEKTAIVAVGSKILSFRRRRA